MAITINGTTGIAGVDGSAGTPAVQGADTNTGIFFPAADTIGFAEGGAEVMRINSSGNVGIGTSSPGAKLDVRGSSTFLVNATNPTAWISVDSALTTGSMYNQWNTTSNVGITGTYTNHPHTFVTNNNERMRIDSSGNLLVGTTTTGYTDSRLVLSLDNSTKWVTGPGAGIATRFYVSASGSGGVYLNGTSATSWTAISDEREKDIIEPITDAANKVSTLRAVIGKYKTDETNTRRSFLIAQDIQAVLPEAVDASNPDLLGVQYTEVIPLLVAAIKEQQALITQLQADVAALKGTP